MRPRFDRALARRIDGLSRRAHAFHRFAHHPLCSEYGGELLQLGKRTRVCRGCTLLIAGIVSGVAAALVARPPAPGAGVAVALAFALAAIGLRLRGPKSVTRLLPGCGLGIALGSGPGSAAIALAALALLYWRYRSRGPDRSPCASCAESAGPVPCRGMAKIVRAERAFQRLSGRWLTQAGASPVARPGS
jgi:hypothetical protein